MTIACMTKPQYDKLAKFYHDWEGLREDGYDKKPGFKKPWPTFTEDVKNIENELFVSHYTPDNLPKKNKKVLRKRGVIQRDVNGNPIIQTGDSVRGSLHKGTFYGAIKQTVKSKKGDIEEVTKYVVRKKVNDLSDADLKNVVDKKVRAILIQARQQEKLLREKIDNLNKQLQKAEEYEESDIKADIEKLKNDIRQLYAMPCKDCRFIPIKKARVIQKTVTNPLKIKEQRDKSLHSDKPHKQHYYATNDGNFLIILYEGTNEKGKRIRDCRTINNLDTAKHLQAEVQSSLKEQGLSSLHGLYESYIPEQNTKLETVCHIKNGYNGLVLEEFAK